MTTSYNGSPQLSEEKPRIYCMTVRTPALPCLSQLLCRNPSSGTMSSLQNSENPSFSPEETNLALPPHLTWLRNNSGFPFIKLSCPSRTLGPERLSYVTIMQCIFHSMHLNICYLSTSSPRLWVPQQQGPISVSLYSQGLTLGSHSIHVCWKKWMMLEFKKCMHNDCATW